MHSRCADAYGRFITTIGHQSCLAYVYIYAEGTHIVCKCIENVHNIEMYGEWRIANGSYQVENPLLTISVSVGPCRIMNCVLLLAAAPCKNP